MSDSNDVSFRPSKNLISDNSICFVNSPSVVIVAMIVSPCCVSLCWKFRDGAAVAMDIRKSK